MSVLIKGMQLPDMCGHCRFATAFECEVTKNFITTFNVRQADCPLIPVPPHGRLGDLDELKTAFPCGESIRTESIRATIDHMPTIIPASEEGEA